MRLICCSFLMVILLSGVTAKLWDLDPIKDKQETQKTTKETVEETQKTTEEIVEETIIPKKSMDTEETIIPKKSMDTESKEVSSCPKNTGYEVTVLKQIIGKLLNQFQPHMIPGKDAEKVEFNMKIKMSALDLNQISLYLDKNEDIYEVEEVLTSMLGEVSSKDMLSQLPQTFYEKYSFYVLMMVPSLVLFLALKFMHLPLRVLIKLSFFLVFWISVFWNWYFLYQESYTKYTTAIEKGPPEKCKNDYKAGFFESLSSSFSEMFHVPIDECEEYHLITSIPPGLRIPPTEAISFCIVNTLLKPLASVGENVGLFFQKLSQQIPLPLLIIAVVFILIILLFVIVVSNGYSIGGLLISVTPPQPAPPPPPPPPPLEYPQEIMEKLGRIIEKLDNVQNIDCSVKEIREVLLKIPALDRASIESGPGPAEYRGVQESEFSLGPSSIDTNLCPLNSNSESL